MKILYYSLFIAAALMLIFLIRMFLQSRKSIPVMLFMEALRNENSGNYEAAILGYETALAEVSKSGFSKNGLTAKITGKLKVLKSLISYQENFHYGNDRWQGKSEKDAIIATSTKHESIQQ